MDDAVAMGIDGFSMNIGDPDEDFVVDTLATMMDYARDEYPGQFYIHISMDLWAAGNKSKNWQSYTDLLKRFFAHDAYERRTNAKRHPMVTTFSDGGMHNTHLDSWRGLFDGEMYFIPDWDGTVSNHISPLEAILWYLSVKTHSAKPNTGRIFLHG